mgnify:CR=1 FL=1
MLLQFLSKQGAVGNLAVFKNYVEYVGLTYNSEVNGNKLTDKQYKIINLFHNDHQNMFKDNWAILAFTFKKQHAHVLAYADARSPFWMMGKDMILRLFCEACENAAKLLNE